VEDASVTIGIVGSLADAAPLPGHERLRDSTHLSRQSALDPFADPSTELAQAEDQAIHAAERDGRRL